MKELSRVPVHLYDLVSWMYDSSLFLFSSSFNLVELDCFLLSIVLRLFIPFRFFIILLSSELGTLLVTFSRLLCYSGWGL